MEIDFQFRDVDETQACETEVDGVNPTPARRRRADLPQRPLLQPRDRHGANPLPSKGAKGLKDLKLKASQGQNLASTVLCVPHELDLAQRPLLQSRNRHGANPPLLRDFGTL